MKIFHSRNFQLCRAFSFFQRIVPELFFDSEIYAFFRHNGRETACNQPNFHWNRWKVKITDRADIPFLDPAEGVCFCKFVAEN